MPLIRHPLRLQDLPDVTTDKTGWPWTEQSELLPDGSEYPLISIVTPNYNQAQFLEETIRSVLLQGYPNLEYIIIDAGSTDYSLEIIKKYEPFLAYWVSEPDRGQSHGINKGLERCTGDFIGWINSSDCYMQNALEKVFKHSEVQKNDFIFGNSLFVGKAIDDCQAVVHKGIEEFSLKYILRFFQSSHYIIPSQNVFISKQLLEKSGFLREDLHYCMDLEWFARISLCDPSALCIKLPFAFYRHHSDAKTSLNNGGIKEEAFSIAKEYSKHMEKRERHELLNLMKYETEYFNYQRNLKSKTLWNLLNTVLIAPKESLSDSRFLGLLKRAIFDQIARNKT